jgi:epoxyqueuosine reductase
MGDSTAVTAVTAVAARTLEESIRAHAYGLGFDLAGIATLGSMDTAPHFDRWLDRGFAGDMHYLPKWAHKRHDSRLPYEGVRSAIVVAMSYGGREPSGPVARYARGDDYHDVLDAKLRELHAWLSAELGRDVRGRAYVDTGPLLERDLAQRAGLGWFGKNTNLINPKLGSFFFLGALLVDLELSPDEPFASDHCGTCTRCIDACPTAAIVEPLVLDATKCISYLTIEAKGEIPLALRESIGELIYGCDICQSCCPWNVRFSQELKEPAFAPREALTGRDARTLARELLGMTQEHFSAAFKGSPMKRAKLRGLKRNAAVVLGNTGDARDVGVLTEALYDPEPLVREHAAWALGRVSSPEALDGLRAREPLESDPARC